MTATGNTLSATLTDTANAYAYVLCHSYAGALLHLEQEFEVTPSDPKYGWVVLTMSVKVDGHLRTDINGGASLKIASATVQPAGGGEALGLALSPRQMGGMQGSQRVLEEASSTPQVVPAGRFLLVADFVVEATADHICKGHGEVDFARFPRGGMGLAGPSIRKDGYQGLRPQRHRQSRHALKDRTGRPFSELGSSQERRFDHRRVREAMLDAPFPFVFRFGFSLHLRVTGSAITLVVSRLQSSLRVYFALMLRPASWLALFSRTYPFELAQPRLP